MPQLGYTIIYVPSVPETIAFYERAFGFEGSFIHEGKDYGELKTGPTRLSFTAHALAAQAVPFTYRAVEDGDRPLGMEITLTVEDVDGVHARAVAAGAEELAKPHDTPWGQRVSYLKDLNGLAVALGSPMP